MPVYLKSQNIIKEWVDYNNHLNMAYYVLIFDQALEVILEKFNMGAKSAKTEKRSTMVVETNTKYINEVQEGIEIDIFLTFFDHDKKRLHLKMEMVEKKTKKISASIEWLSLYVNLETRKVTEFESEKIIIMDSFIKENKNNFNNENLKLEIIEKKTKKVSASIEWLSLYVNLETRKVTEFENKKVAIMNNFIEQNKNNFNYEDIKFSSKLKK